MVLMDVENQLALGTMTRLINNQDDMAVLTKIDHEISEFLDLYSVSLHKNIISIVVANSFIRQHCLLMFTRLFLEIEKSKLLYVCLIFQHSGFCPDSAIERAF